MGSLVRLLAFIFAGVASCTVACGESGYKAWLRYTAIEDKAARDRYAQLPAVVVSLDRSPILQAASEELVRGVQGMLGRTLRVQPKLPQESAILLGTYESVKKVAPALETMPQLPADGFWLKSLQIDGQNCVLITAPNERGVLYGTFFLLGKIAFAQPIEDLNEQHSPGLPHRVLNHRDGLDGTLERGFGKQSIFWNDGEVTLDLDRVRDYARLIASVGVNGIAVNSPAAGPRLMTPAKLKDLSTIADATRPWGVRLFLAINSVTPPNAATSAPLTAGDAAMKSTAAAWATQIEQIYRQIPDLGGLVLEADWGPIDQPAELAAARAEAINQIAAALKPHGGVLFVRTCRCGVAVDPADPKQDAAKAAYETFQPLDGRFADNVILQIKQGPMDFQVREAPSPLFGALEKTNQAAEMEISQHYLGQQRHLCFLVPMWKDVLDFDMQAKKDGGTPVKQLIAGAAFERPTGGMVAIVNVDRADNWLGHDLALANLYGFGRLAWNPNLSAKSIADEWTRLTFGHDPLVVGAVVDMLLKSWRVVENYTGPLGAGSLTDLGAVQYGPGIETGEPTSWAPWHNADAMGIGKDRTAATGSGFIGQYRPGIAAKFESQKTCPDSLLLFMHHVPYTHVLNSGKTVIQHIYDAHYDGAREAGRLVQQWQALKGHIDDERHEAVLSRLEYQAGHAQVWRDAVCTWFLHKSGIADNEGRVGNYPNRIEAESLELAGYERQNVVPWETASGGQAAQCVDPAGHGSLSLKFEGKAGWYRVSVTYFDENDGASKFRLLVGEQIVGEWTADDELPDNKPNGHTATRYQSPRVALRPGDTIRIEATVDRGERAAIDYLEIDAAG